MDFGHAGHPGDRLRASREAGRVRLSARLDRGSDPAAGKDDDDLRYFRRAHRSGSALQAGGAKRHGARHPPFRSRGRQARQRPSRCLRQQAHLPGHGSAMRIKFWGTRGTRPTPGKRTLRYGGNTTCLEVRDKDDNLIIIDSGSGIAELGGGFEQAEPLQAHLLITHTHLDHIQGFPFFPPAFVPGTHLTIVGPAGSAKSLQAAFADQMDPAYFPVRLDHMPAEMEFIERNPGETFEVGGLRITPHLVMHPIPTFGYRIDEGSTRFAFATDNEIAMFANNENGTLKDLVAWCQDADLLVHDAQYSREEYRTHAGFGHSTYEEALSLAEQADVQQLAFFHHDPAHSDADIDALIEEALGNHRQSGGNDVVAFPAAEDQELPL
ncbi:MAG: MBL fold metallo-hydrolase [Chloroflexi bacterium]|nr:MAG: MBL fold metallo-hydrolase [Chloroflexota bacterium]